MAESIITDKAELLSKITKSTTALKNADPKLLKDKKFIEEAVMVNPSAIKYADESLTNNENFILSLLKIKPEAYRYLTGSRKNRVPIVLAAVSDCAENIQYVSASAKKMLVHYNFNRNECKNRNIALLMASVSSYGMAKYFSAFADDKEIVLKVLEHDDFHYQFFVSDRLKSDIDVLRCVYLHNSYILTKPEFEKQRAEIITDRDLVMQSMKNCKPYMIEPEYADDKEIVLLAVSIHAENFQFASDQLKDNAAFVKKAMKIDNSVLQFASYRLRDDEDFIRKAISLDAANFAFASERLRNDDDYIKTFLSGKLDQRAYKLLSNIAPLLQDNKDFILWLFENYSDSLFLLHLASERLRNDRKFIIELLEVIANTNGKSFILDYLSDTLKNDREIVLMCLMATPTSFKYVPKKLQHDRDFILEVVTNLEIDISDDLPDKFKNDIEIKAALKLLKDK